MDIRSSQTNSVPAQTVPEGAAVAILVAISFSHLLNDLIQSMIPAIYPILKRSFSLSFTQIGLITLAFQLTASLLQPLIGYQTDRKASPYSLVVGMSFTLVGLILLSIAASYPMLLVAASMVGIGSSVFHPESSRIARMASGGRHGMAQSVFQVGGYTGSALGPLLAALIVVPRGQPSVAWFSLAALLAIIVLFQVGRWYQGKVRSTKPRLRDGHGGIITTRKTIVYTLAILILLIFSKQFYIASFSSYFTFYLIAKFHLSVQASQVYLFAFLAAIAVGTLVGGPIGDRIGRKYVIWGSILGALPFTLALPYVDLFWTGVLSVIVGLIPVVGLSRHRRLRSGTPARTGRNHCRSVFRFVVRNERGGCRCPRLFGGSDEHRIRLLDLFFLAGPRSAGRFPARRRSDPIPPDDLRNLATIVVVSQLVARLSALF